MWCWPACGATSSGRPLSSISKIVEMRVAPAGAKMRAQSTKAVNVLARLKARG